MSDKSLMSMSRRDSDALFSSMRDSQKYVTSQRSDPKSKKGPVKVVTEMLGVGVGALGVGYLAGRLESTGLGGTAIPAGLVATAAGHALAYFNVFGDTVSENLHNVANGTFAGWIALWGAGHGTNARLKAGKPVTAIDVGASGASMASGASGASNLLPARGFMPPQNHLTEAELIAIASKIRR